MKSGDKLICVKPYVKTHRNGYIDYIFYKNNIYNIGRIDENDKIIGIIMKESSVTEFNLSYDENSEYFYKKYFTTLAELRELRINKILDL